MDFTLSKEEWVLRKSFIQKYSAPKAVASLSFESQGKSILFQTQRDSTFRVSVIRNSRVKIRIIERK